MGLPEATETIEKLCRIVEPLAEADREYVIQFAFRTGDEELTDMLIDELIKPEADRTAVCRRFETMTGPKPDLIRKTENLLIALEMYRNKEERAVKDLSQILSAYGVSITEEELKNADMHMLNDKIKREASL